MRFSLDTKEVPQGLDAVVAHHRVGSERKSEQSENRFHEQVFAAAR